MRPKITVIIPTYNRAYILPRTLDSVLAQTFEDWECFVVDDHSTDGSRTLIESYCERDSRFKYLLNDRKKGAQGARNTGLYASDSEWVMFFDSDNVMHSDALELLLSEEDSGYDVITGFFNAIDADSGDYLWTSDSIIENHIHKDLLDGVFYIDFNHIIVRRSKMIEIGGLDEDCPSLQEFDTNIRLSRTASYHTVQKPVIDYYCCGSDSISRNVEKQVRGKFYILKKHKREWLTNKKNADRLLYELFVKLRNADDAGFKIKYIFKILLTFPEIVTYHSARKFRIKRA